VTLYIQYCDPNQAQIKNAIGQNGLVSIAIREIQIMTYTLFSGEGACEHNQLQNKENKNKNK
jgi:hypothetical protein